MPRLLPRARTTVITPSTRGAKAIESEIHQQRAAVEDHVIEFLQGPLDEVHEQLAFQQFGRITRAAAGRHDRKVRHFRRANALLKHVRRIEHVAEAVTSLLTA